MSKISIDILTSHNESFLKAWQNVEYVSKKDGSPYKVASKSVKNATIKNGKIYVEIENSMDFFGYEGLLGFESAPIIDSYDIERSVEHALYFEIYRHEHYAKNLERKKKEGVEFIDSDNFNMFAT